MRRQSIVLILAALALLLVGCGDSLPTEGMVAHYELNGDGSDSAGDSRGELVGGLTVPGRSGAGSVALQFGEGDYIEIPHTEVISLAQDFTIAAWINPAAGAPSGSFQTIFEKSDPERGGHSRYGLWLRDSQLWACFEASDNSRQPCAETGDVVELGAWQHVAAVRSGRRLIIYVDGVEESNTFVGLHAVSQTPNSAFIGTDRYQEPAEWLYATLDDVRVYNVALERGDIAALAES